MTPFRSGRHFSHYKFHFSFHLSIATSVSVSAWTLVAISVERYCAICHPLRSRRWQTINHAYKSIVLIWIASLFFMLPIAMLSKLIPTSQGECSDSILIARGNNSFPSAKVTKSVEKCGQRSLFVMREYTICSWTYSSLCFR